MKFLLFLDSFSANPLHISFFCKYFNYCNSFHLFFPITFLHCMKHPNSTFASPQCIYLCYGKARKAIRGQVLHAHFMESSMGPKVVNRLICQSKRTKLNQGAKSHYPQSDVSHCTGLNFYPTAGFVFIIAASGHISLFIVFYCRLCYVGEYF